MKLVRAELSDFDHVISPELRLVLSHWLELRGDKLLPAKSDIDASAIAAALPHLAIYEHKPEDDGYLCHLVGDEIYSHTGRDLRGRRLSDGFPNHQPLAGIFSLALTRRAIIYGTGIFSFGNVTTPAESLVLPLTGDAGAGFIAHCFRKKHTGRVPVSDIPDQVDLVNTMTPAYAEAGCSKIVSTQKRISRDVGGRLFVASAAVAR